ncbi:aquaporin-8-like [Coregonus clupeaformis]|uniref:aquaporin-8-like n=1 Tax=Coregonus clupeaformis TaxID=59861 RepID=UPI001BE12AFA|nr:aquaporin-8-like [Coregonus clupeaformis]
MALSESKTELWDLDISVIQPEGKGPGPATDGTSGTKPFRGAFERYVQPCLAELLGSSLFIFVGCLSVIENTEGTGRLQPALAHGLALGIVIAVLGEISGGHFNPAVSVSVFLIGGLNIILLVPYILAQMCGGMIGAGLAKVISPAMNYAKVSGAAFNTVQADTQIVPATVAEVIMTLFLTMVVCMGAVNGRTRSLLAPLCIGLTVTADILAGGAVSGACMNPARAFGPAVVANYWSYHWIYWVGPMSGALLTASLIRLLLGDEKTRVLLR